MMSIFVVLGLLLCVQAEVTPVFLQTGDDLLLDVQTNVTLGGTDQILWRVNNTKYIARFSKTGPVIFSSYSGRAEFFGLNFSLLLKNVTQRDGGYYRARVFGDGVTDVAEYNVTVLGFVEAVPADISACTVRVIVISSGLIVMVCAVISVHVKKRK